MAHVAKQSPGSQRPWNATPVKPGTTLIAKEDVRLYVLDYG